MKQKILDHSLEIFCAVIIVLTLVRILFFETLPLVRNLINGYALIAVLHEFEEKRLPGGFYEMMGGLFKIPVERMNLGLSGSFVMLFWVIVLTISFVFDHVIVFFIMLIVLGFIETFAHTAAAIVTKHKPFYSPGMASAWLMGIMSVYSIFKINQAHLATGWDYLIGTILMLISFVILQRATLLSSGMSYPELLANARKVLFSSKGSQKNA